MQQSETFQRLHPFYQQVWRLACMVANADTKAVGVQGDMLGAMLMYESINK